MCHGEEARAASCVRSSRGQDTQKNVELDHELMQPHL